MKRFDSADELSDYLADLNAGDVPSFDAVGGCVILVTGTPWLAYCTDPDAEWFFECGDPEDRMTEDSEGWREYDRIGMDWIGPQVDAHGAELLWPRSADLVQGDAKLRENSGDADATENHTNRTQEES